MLDLFICLNMGESIASPLKHLRRIGATQGVKSFKAVCCYRMTFHRPFMLNVVERHVTFREAATLLEIAVDKCRDDVLPSNHVLKNLPDVDIEAKDDWNPAYILPSGTIDVRSGLHGEFCTSQ